MRPDRSPGAGSAISPRRRARSGRICEADSIVPVPAGHYTASEPELARLVGRWLRRASGGSRRAPGHGARREASAISLRESHPRFPPPPERRRAAACRSVVGRFNPCNQRRINPSGGPSSIVWRHHGMVRTEVCCNMRSRRSRAAVLDRGRAPIRSVTSRICGHLAPARGAQRAPTVQRGAEGLSQVLQTAAPHWRRRAETIAQTAG